MVGVGVDVHANKSESTSVENSTFSANRVAINTRKLEAKNVTANAEHMDITVTGKATLESQADTATCSSSSASFSTSGTASVSHHEGSVKQVKEQTVFNARQSLTFTADEMHNTGAALTCDTPGGLTITANSVTNANTDEHRKERGISVAVSRNPNESERTDDPKVPVGSAITSVSKIGYLRKEDHSAVLPTAVNADTATLNLPGMEAVNTDAEQTRKQISSSKTQVKIVLPTVNLAQAKETVSKVPSLFTGEGNTPTISERPRSKGKEEEVEEELPSVNEQEDWVFLSQKDSESSSSTSSSSVHDIEEADRKTGGVSGPEEDPSLALAFAHEFGQEASNLANRSINGVIDLGTSFGYFLRDIYTIAEDAYNGTYTPEMKSGVFLKKRTKDREILDQEILSQTRHLALAIGTCGASIAIESAYHAGVSALEGDKEGTQDALVGTLFGLLGLRAAMQGTGVPKTSAKTGDTLTDLRVVKQISGDAESLLITCSEVEPVTIAFRESDSILVSFGETEPALITQRNIQTVNAETLLETETSVAVSSRAEGTLGDYNRISQQQGRKPKVNQQSKQESVRTKRPIGNRKASSKGKQEASTSSASEKKSAGKAEMPERPKEKVKTTGVAGERLGYKGENYPVKLPHPKSIKINQWAHQVREPHLRKWRNKEMLGVTEETQLFIRKIDKAIKNNLKPDDLAGYAKEKSGHRIPNGKGGFYDHITEVNNAKRSILKSLDLINQRFSRLNGRPGYAADCELLLEKYSDLHRVFHKTEKLKYFLEK